MIRVLILNALFASTFTIGKVALGYSTPVFFIAISMLCGGALAIAFQFFTAPSRLAVRRADIPLFLQVAFFSIFLSYTLQFWGLQYLPSFKACFLYNSGPFFSYLFAFVIFGQKMRLKKWLGLGIGFLGLLPVLSSASPGEASVNLVSFLSLPEVAVIISTAAYSYGWFLIKTLVHQRHYAALTVNGIVMLLGGLMALIATPFIDGPVHVTDAYPFATMLFATVVIEYLICNNLYARLLDTYSETFLSFTTFLIPLFGALYGWFFLNEAITWQFFISCVIVFMAIMLFYRAEMEENPSHLVQD